MTQLSIAGVLFFNFTLFYSTFCFAMNVWAEEPELITMAPLTSQVQARYYTIERITKTMHALYTVHKKHPEITKLPDTFFTNSSYFTNSPLYSQVPITQCIERIKTQQTIVPFFELWRQVCSYKYVDNPAVAIEFSQLLWTIMRHTVSQLSDKKIITKTEDALSTAREQELHQDAAHTPSPPAIAFRFYLIKRLQAVNAYLTDYQKYLCASSAHDKNLHPRRRSDISKLDMSKLDIR